MSSSGLLGGVAEAVVGPLPTTPTFVLPYKRFAAPWLLALATQYLNEPRTTYRATVRHDRCLIGYPVKEGKVAAEESDATTEHASTEQDHDHQPVIPPSLAWRFVGWLGSLTMVLDKAREMILLQDPNSLCHRVAGSVAAHKARSKDRMATLQTAQQLLLIMPEWEECFSSRFFPRFATRSGFD